MFASPMDMPDPSAAIFNSPAMNSLKLALEAASQRQVALAANVANVNTPGYKRVDLSPTFQASLDQAMKAAQEGQAPPPVTTPALSQDPNAGPPRLDGNNVRIDQEMLELMNNSSTYEMATRLLAKQYGMVRTAIAGH